MVEEFFPGTSLGNMDEADFAIALEEAVEADDSSKGLGIVDGLAYLGFWRVRPGGDLRIGLRRDDRFIGMESVRDERLPERGNVDLILERLLMPDLPTGRTCAVQMNWSVSHLFSNGSKSVAHVTCVEASPGAAARASGVPLFSNLAARQGLDLKLGIVAVTDPRDNPIISILGSDVLKTGLRLASHFNPVFASTVTYVNAVTKGLTDKSRRNYKLAEWRCGLSNDPRARLPLVEGDYIMLDGKLRLEGSDEDVRWDKMTWNSQAERVDYDGVPFVNSHIIIRVQKTREAVTEQPPPAPQEPTPTPPARAGTRSRGA